MNTVITSRLVVAASVCPRKAYFLIRGEPAPCPHEYEQIVEERASRNRTEYFSSRAIEESGMIVVGDLAADCDAVEGPSPAKQEAHLVIGTHTPTSSDKLRLAFNGYALEQQSRCRPSSGVIVPFREPPKRVKLEPLYPTVKTAIKRLRSFATDPLTDAPDLTRHGISETKEPQ